MYRESRLIPWVSDSGRPTTRKEIRCECGAWVLCQHPLTNGCDCGREYNMSGQLLAPRSQWGEETGESISDILGPTREEDFL